MNPKTPHILIVDDDKDLLATLSDILKLRGFETVKAETGKAALAEIQNREFEVALIDLRLNDMPGLDVLSGIKAHSPDTECILLTGNATKDSAIKAVQMNAFGYFQKPFEMEQVLQSIKQAADKQQAAQALRISEKNLARQNKQLKTINDLTVHLLNGQGVDEIMQTLLDYGKELMDAPYISVNLLEGDDILITRAATANHQWLIGDRSRRGETGHLSWQAVETGEIAALDDYSKWEQSRDIYEALKLRAVAEVPIKREGKVIGVLSFSRDQEGYLFTQQDLETAELLGRIAALILDNAQLHESAQKEIAERKAAEETLRQQNEYLSSIRDITLELLQESDIDSLLNVVAARSAELIQARYSYIFLAEGNELVLRAATHNFSAKIGSREPKPGKGLLATVWNSKQKFVVENYGTWEERDPAYEEWNLHAIVGIPIIIAGEIIGVLEVSRTGDDNQKFSKTETEALAQFANMASLALGRKQVQEQRDEVLNRLENVMDNMPVACIIMDSEHHITYWNKAAENIFGYTQAEVMGKIHYNLGLSDEARVQVEVILETALNHNRSISNINENITKDRRTIICQWSNTPLQNAKGEPLGILAMAQDITARKQSEEKITQQNEFLHLLNAMTQAIIASDDFNAMTKILVNDMASLLNAEDCFITKWDEEKGQVFPIAVNGQADYTKVVYPKGEKNLTTSALEAGDIIIADEAHRSAYTSPNVLSQFSAMTVMAIPLIFGKHKIGAAIIGHRKEHSFSAEEIKRARQAGNQIAIALWDAQQDLELQRSLRETQALADIALALSETESVGLNNMLNLIVQSTQSLITNAEQTVIHLLDEDEKTLNAAAVAGFAEPEERETGIPLGAGIAAQVIENGQAINIADVNSDPRFIKRGADPAYSSLLVAPIHSGKIKLGTISVQSSLAYAFTANDINLLNQLGTQAAIAIENVKLLEKTKQALKEANAFYRVNKGLVASLDPDDLLQDTVELLQQNFDYHYVQIFVVDPESGNFIMRAGSGVIGAQLKARGHQLAAGEGIVGYTAETGTAFFTNDVDNSMPYARNPLLPDVRSELTVPVKIGKEILGLLDIQQTPPKFLSQHDIQLVSGVANQLAIALQKAGLYESLQISLQQEKAIRNQLVQNERLAVMGRLLASVSHELNNPLQAIQNALFLLKEETHISDQGKQDLGIVLTESERMSNLIERLRDTYRPTESEDFRLTQVNSIVENVHTLTATHLRNNLIAFEFHPDPQLPEILALPDQIHQVTLNLLMNASEAMEGGGKIIVSTQFIKEADEILLTVEDSGPGIPQNLLPTIFEAFVTGKSSGTGLGLTISYEIVMKHRGRIIAENKGESGAVFKVWLPINNGEIII